MPITCVPCLAPFERKLVLFRPKASAKALYGTESAPAPQGQLKKLSGAFKAAVVSGFNGMAAQSLACAEWGKRNPDPACGILLRRAKQLRRMYATGSPFCTQVDTVLQSLVLDSNAVGILKPGSESDGLIASAITQRLAAQQPCEARAGGPVELFLCSLASAGCAISVGWQLFVPGWPVLAFHRAPWELLSFALRGAMVDSAVQRLATTRQPIGPSPLIDWQALPRRIKGMEPKLVAIARALHSGAIITASQLHKAGVLDTAACREYGHPKADLWHLLWECPHHQARRQQCLDFINLTPDCMPECLSLHGLPPARGSEPRRPWAGALLPARAVFGCCHTALWHCTPQSLRHGALAGWDSGWPHPQQ